MFTEPRHLSAPSADELGADYPRRLDLDRGNPAPGRKLEALGHTVSR
jgi:hypothetical protein